MFLFTSYLISRLEVPIDIEKIATTLLKNQEGEHKKSLFQQKLGKTPSQECNRQEHHLSIRTVPGNRAGGSATRKQRSMPGKVPNLVNEYQGDNLGLKVNVPEQMSCRLGDAINCLQVKDILSRAEQPLILHSPYKEAIAASTQKGDRRSLRFLLENLPGSTLPFVPALVSMMVENCKEEFGKEKLTLGRTLRRNRGKTSIHTQ